MSGWRGGFSLGKKDWLWGFAVGSIILSLSWGAVFWYILNKPEPAVEKECLSGFVTIEGTYGQRLIIGDAEICGVDLEMSNIIGPSKLYDSGDPL